LTRPELSVVALAPAQETAEARSDDDLMLLARGGVSSAFDALVRRHQAAVLGLARRVVGDPATAEDVAQESFVDLHASLETYEPRGKLRAYLLRVTLNRARRSRRGAARSPITLGPVPEVATSPEGEARILAEERQVEVQRAVDRLPRRQREVLALRFGAGLPHAEIAEVLGVPVGTVKSRLYHALRKLRPRLGELEHD